MEKDFLEGYVYIATHPYYKEKVKIGLTHGQKHPSTRVKELSKSTEVLENFKCEWYIKVSDCKLAEALLHNHFNDSRIKHNKEFFEITLEKAVLESEGILYDFFKSLNSDRFCSIPIQFMPITSKESLEQKDDGIILQEINYPFLLTNVQIVDITERIKTYYRVSDEIISLRFLQVTQTGIWLEVIVKHSGNFDEITQKINISNFKSNQLSLFEGFNTQFDLNESVEFNTQILFYNLKEICSSIIEFEIHYLTGGCLFELIEDVEEIELQDFENFNEEVRDGCVRILEIINNNLKKYKISGKTKKKNLLELTIALINLPDLPDLPDIQNREYSLEISHEVRNEKDGESKHWSIEFGYGFKVNSYVSKYQSEIGGDWFTSFNYSQNRGESYYQDGYFSTWIDELYFKQGKNTHFI